MPDMLFCKATKVSLNLAISAFTDLIELVPLFLNKSPSLTNLSTMCCVCAFGLDIS